MQPPDPASVLARQDALFAWVDVVIDTPLPDFSDEMRPVALERLRDWLLGPFLTVGRQLVRAPDGDRPGADRAVRKAGVLLRLAHEAAATERAVLDRHDLEEELDAPEGVMGRLEHELRMIRLGAASEREKLRGAIREVAGPLLPRAHDELRAWVLERIAPTPDADVGPTAARKVKGRDFDGQMMLMMHKNPDSIFWSCRKWAKELNGSDGTIKATKAWKVLKKLRAQKARGAAEGMDRSQLRSTGRRPRADAD